MFMTSPLGELAMAVCILVGPGVISTACEQYTINNRNKDITAFMHMRGCRKIYIFNLAGLPANTLKLTISLCSWNGNSISNVFNTCHVLEEPFESQTCSNRS